jgi:hypothetical protein
MTFPAHVLIGEPVAATPGHALVRRSAAQQLGSLAAGTGNRTRRRTPIAHDFRWHGNCFVGL